MRFLIVRHGETEHNKDDSITGQMDVPLNDYGVEQAEKAADRLERYDFAAACSSDLQRTYETTKIIAERHGLHPERYKEFRERNYGVFEGRHKKEWKKVVSEYDGDDFELSPENGESMKETAQRFLGKLVEISDEHGDEDLVLVGGHGVAIKCVIMEILGLNGKYYRKLATHNTSLTELEYSNSEWRVCRLNDTAHLE